MNFRLKGFELMASDSLDDIIDRFKVNNVYFCQFFGIRSTYGLLPDYRESSIKKRVKDLHSDIRTMKKLIDKENDDFKRFEKKLVLQALESELFNLREIQPHKKFIGAYAEPITNIIMVYASRSYAPIDTRIQDIIKHEQAIPDFLNTGLEVLDKVLSKPLIQMGMGFFQGINSFLETELKDLVDQSSNQELKKEWEESNNKAIEAINNFNAQLKENYLPNSTDEFKLGEKRFLQLLKASEGVDLSVDRLLEIAEMDLEKNYSAMQEILKDEKKEIFEEMNNECPKPENLLEECQKIVNQTKDYLKKSKLLTLPTDEDCQVVETPKFRRAFALASMNLPGLAEPSEGKETYYYITPPEQSWTEEQTNNFMKNFAFGSLHVTTIHEVFPGHFVQGLYYQYVIKSPIVRLFSFSVSISEGWAHYGEELIVDHGYDQYDKTEVKIGQLLGALKRNVRFICAVKMHCMDMTKDEAKELFKEKAYLSEESAQMEAMRGTVDPMYLNYTLGKLFIKKLKEDVKHEKGKKFNEKDFHDSVLKLGMPPIQLMREYLLKKTPITEYL